MHFPKFIKNQKGFSLLLMVLIFLGVALVAYGAITIGIKLQQAGEGNITQDRMDLVQDALKKYYRGHQDLPSNSPVPTDTLGLESKYKLDAYGQQLHYYKTTVTAWGGAITKTDIDGLSVDEDGDGQFNNVAAVIISAGPDQTFQSFDSANPSTTYPNTSWGGYSADNDDIIIGINVTEEAKEIAQEQMDVLRRKLWAFAISNPPGSTPQSDFWTTFGLPDYFKYDPWGGSYVIGTDKISVMNADGTIRLSIPTLNDMADVFGRTPPPLAEIGGNFDSFTTGGSTVSLGGGGNYEGTVSSGVSASSDTTGSSGKSLDFDGSSGSVEFSGSSANFSAKTPFSISVWVKFNELDKTAAIVSKVEEDSAGGRYQGYMLAKAADNKIYFTLLSKRGGDQHRLKIYGSSNLFADEWYHIVVTYNGSFTDSNYGAVEIYIDGVSEKDTTRPGNINTLVTGDEITNGGSLLLSGWKDKDGTLTDPFSGLMDNVAIYSNKTLSSCQTLEVYEGYFSCFLANMDNKLTNSSGTDFMVGTSAAETINGLGGNDLIYGKGGGDTIYGYDSSQNNSTGVDQLYGGDGNDTLYGQDGEDLIYGGFDDDFLDGDNGDDNDSSKDTLYGGKGHDKLYGRDGGDYIYGEDGNDYIEGNDGDDYLYGGDDHDYIDGTAGTDRVYGQNGDDILSGGAGDDYLYGQNGNDIVFGGNGNDTAMYANTYADYSYSALPFSCSNYLKATASDGTEGTDYIYITGGTSRVEYLRFDNNESGTPKTISEIVSDHSLACSAPPAPVSAPTTQTTVTLITPKNFGKSVAVDGETDTSVVGALDDNAAKGAVYIINRSGTTWKSFKLTDSVAATDGDPAGVAGYEYGAAVAIDGDTVVVGAPKKHSATLADLGTVFFYTLAAGDNWSDTDIDAQTDLSEQAARPSDIDTANDYFGSRVDIDNDYAIVGAPGVDNNTDNEIGAAYIYNRTGTTWEMQQKLTASDASANDQFGSSVAIYGDMAVVGAPFDDTNKGAVYVFTRSGKTWTQKTKLTGDAANDYFGRSVALDGNTLVVGADQSVAGGKGKVYIYTLTGPTSEWPNNKISTNGQAANDRFGFSVSVSGPVAVVGAYLNTGTDTGKAYIYYRSGLNTWAAGPTFTGTDANDRFGISVSASQDRVLVGADNNGAVAGGEAYIFGPESETYRFGF